MDNYIASKHLNLVSIIVALFTVTGSSSTKIIGIAGSNVTLKFTFNRTNINYQFNHFNINNSTGKIDDLMLTNTSNKFTIIEKNDTILYHITNLSLQDDQEYYAVWITRHVSVLPYQTSNRVRLVVIVDNRTTTVTPDPTVSSVVEDTVVSQSLSSRALVLILVSPFLLMVTALPCVAWCLLRTREPKQKTQDSFISTVQERVADLPQASGSSLVYSVLDFPQRTSTVLDVNNDTHYATISYLPDNRPV